jgi:hypothetical protein
MGRTRKISIFEREIDMYGKRYRFFESERCIDTDYTWGTETYDHHPINDEINKFIIKRSGLIYE